MARTTKGKKHFPFRIVIVPLDKELPRPPWIGTHRWKHQAISSIKTKLRIQLKKALLRASGKWFKFYWVYGYGAPGKNEFICWYSGMVGKAIKPEEVTLFNDYWAACARKTQEVLNWLDSIPIERFSPELNAYLRRLIIVRYGARELRQQTGSNVCK